MNPKAKHIAICLSLFLVIAGSIPGHAREAHITSATAAPGDSNIAVSLVVEDASGIAGGELSFSFSPDVLSLPSSDRVIKTSLTADFQLVVNIVSPGKVRIALAGNAAIPSGGGALLTVLFDVKPDQPNRTASIQGTGAFWDIEGERFDIPKQFGKGTFTVESPTSGQPDTVLWMSATPDGVLSSGSPATIRVQIMDLNGNLQSGDHTTVVSFTITSGQGSLSASEATASGGVATVTLTSNQPGSVTVRAATNGGQTRSLTVVFQDTAPSNDLLIAKTQKETYATNEEIIVEFSGLPGNPQDWIALAPVSANANSYGDWFYTEGAKEGAHTFKGLQPGEYEVRIYLNNTYNIEAQYAFTVLEDTGDDTTDETPGDDTTDETPGDDTTDGTPGNGTIIESGLIAGSGVKGYAGDGGPATDAQLDYPAAIAIDAGGNVYIAELGNKRVRKIDTSGRITTVAGNGEFLPNPNGGPATEATISSPAGLAVDNNGNLYIALTNLGQIAKVESQTGNMSVIAGKGFLQFSGDGGPASEAGLSNPYGLALDNRNNLYFAERHNNRIRKIDLSTGIISAVAGSGEPGTGGFSGDGGQATEAQLNQPVDVAVDAAGNVYIADWSNGRIRRVDPAGVIATVAGGGTKHPQNGLTATDINLGGPQYVVIDASGNLYVPWQAAILRVDPSGTVTIVAGASGQNDDFKSVSALGMDREDNLYASDSSYHIVKKFSAAELAAITPDGGSTDGTGGQPGDDQTDDGSGTGDQGGGTGGQPDDGGTTSPSTPLPGIGAAAPGSFFKSDGEARKPLIGIIEQIAGTGEQGYSGDGSPATGAMLNQPYGVAVDSAGNVYVVDLSNKRVRMIDTQGVITTVAGNGEYSPAATGQAATKAGLHNPSGIALDTNGDLYISVVPGSQGQILKIDAATGAIGPVAETPAGEASFGPNGLALDGEGGLYVADRNSHLVRKVDLGTGTMITVAGKAGGAGGYAGDGGPATDALLNWPKDVALDADGNLYIADSSNQRIRKVDTDGIITTVAGGGTKGLGDSKTHPPYVATDHRANATSVVVDSRGIVYTEASDAFGILAIFPNGKMALLDLGATPSNLDIGPDGALYAAMDNRVLRITPPALAFQLKTSSLAIKSDGVSSTTLRAELVDANTENPVNDSSIRVQFEIVEGMGTLSASDVAVDNGVAAVTLTSNTPGMLTVQAGGNGLDTQTVQIAVVERFHMEPGNGPLGTVVDRAAASLDPNVSLLIGGGVGDGGSALDAYLNRPSDLFYDRLNNLYIADELNHRVRRVDANTGEITTVAGRGTPGYSGDGGAATEAHLNRPSGIFIDGSGNLYIADKANNRVRMVDALGVITTVAGDGAQRVHGIGAYLEVGMSNADDELGRDYLGPFEEFRGIFFETADHIPATRAHLNGPSDIFVDAAGNLFIADTNNRRVRRVDAATGIITTVAGGGKTADGPTATDLFLGMIMDVFVDRSGDLYVAEFSKIRKVDLETGVHSVVANIPLGIARMTLDESGNIYVSRLIDISKWDAETDSVMSVAGGGYVLRGVLAGGGVWVDRNGSIISAEENRIQRTDADHTITRIAGKAVPETFTSETPIQPRRLLLAKDGTLYIADQQHNCVLKRDTHGAITVLLGGGDEHPEKPSLFTLPTSLNIGQPTGLAFDASGRLLVATTTYLFRQGGFTGFERIAGKVLGVGVNPNEGDQALDVFLNSIADVASDSRGNVFFFEGNTYTVWKLDPSGVITKFAGNGAYKSNLDGAEIGDGGQATDASLSNVSSLFVDAQDRLYIGDSNNRRVRRVDASGEITTVVGSSSTFSAIGDGWKATEARLSNPTDATIGEDGSLYIADSGNFSIRKVDPEGIIQTLAGPPPALTESSRSVGSDPFYSLAGFSDIVVELSDIQAIQQDAPGTLWVADGNRILQLTVPSRRIVLQFDRNIISTKEQETATLEARILKADGSLDTDDSVSELSVYIIQGAGTLAQTRLSVNNGVARTELRSNTPGVMAVQAYGAGLKSGAAQIQVRGEAFFIYPPILHLTEGETATLEIRDKSGNQVTGDVSYFYDLLNSSGRFIKKELPLISIAPDGKVTALRTEFFGPPDKRNGEFFYAAINGQSAANAVNVRVLSADYGIGPMVGEMGEHTALYYPESINGENIAEDMARFEVLKVNEYAYQIAKNMTGKEPNGGERLEFSPSLGEAGIGEARPEDRLAGVFGGRATLGVWVGQNVRSQTGSFLLSSELGPEWSTYYHELGHFVTVGPLTFRTLPAGPFGEVFANILGLEVLYHLSADPEKYPLGPEAKASVDGNLSRHPEGFKSSFQTWLDNGADFEQVRGINITAESDHDSLSALPGDIDILTGMYMTLREESGASFGDRFFDVFRDENFHHFLDVSDRVGANQFWGTSRALTGGHTFWAAILSAAAGQDLSARFRDTYHYPIIQDLFDQTYVTAMNMLDGPGAGQTGEPQPPSPDFDGDGEVGFRDFVLFAQRFGTREGQENFDAKFDLDASGDVGFRDFVMFAQSFGKPVGKRALSKRVSGPGINQKAVLVFSPRSGEAAGPVEVIVSLSDVTQVQGYYLQLNYDDSALELVSASTSGKASLFADHLLDTNPEDNKDHPVPVALQTEVKPGELLLADHMKAGSEVAEAGDLLRLTFRILDETVPGWVELSNILVSDPTGRINELMGIRTDLRALPLDYALAQNYPNPFNPETAIPYQLPESGKVSLVIYNTLGQQVHVLMNERQEAGYYRAVWDGKDRLGRQVASGIYLVRMQAGTFTQVRKMVLLK
ncbi:MAG: cohesin domain-containing protein [bacterium]|nr:cohesin domain-containing protein [bacterium]